MFVSLISTQSRVARTMYNRVSGQRRSTALHVVNTGPDCCIPNIASYRRALFVLFVGFLKVPPYSRNGNAALIQVQRVGL